MDRNRPPHSKLPSSSGISPAEFGQLKSEVHGLKQLVSQLQTALNEKNTWNSTVRGWVDSRVVVETSSGKTHQGVLLWIDRYTIALKDDGREKIIHKACIEAFYQA